jgi:hypothetical protein
MERVATGAPQFQWLETGKIEEVSDGPRLTEYLGLLNLHHPITAASAPKIVQELQEKLGQRWMTHISDQWTSQNFEPELRDHQLILPIDAKDAVKSAITEQVYRPKLEQFAADLKNCHTVDDLETALRSGHQALKLCLDDEGYPEEFQRAAQDFAARLAPREYPLLANFYARLHMRNYQSREPYQMVGLWIEKQILETVLTSLGTRAEGALRAELDAMKKLPEDDYRDGDLQHMLATVGEEPSTWEALNLLVRGLDTWPSWPLDLATWLERHPVTPGGKERFLNSLRAGLVQGFTTSMGPIHLGHAREALEKLGWTTEAAPIAAELERKLQGPRFADLRTYPCHQYVYEEVKSDLAALNPKSSPDSSSLAK